MGVNLLTSVQYNVLHASSCSKVTLDLCQLAKQFLKIPCHSKQTTKRWHRYGLHFIGEYNLVVEINHANFTFPLLILVHGLSVGFDAIDKVCIAQVERARETGRSAIS